MIHGHNSDSLASIWSVNIELGNIGNFVIIYRIITVIDANCS